MAASRRILTSVGPVYSRRLCLSSQMYVNAQRSIRCFATSHVKEEEGPELPNGFLFNEKPLLPGQKRQKESWENLWLLGMFGNLLLAGILYWYKPDTFPSTLARIEAERRLSVGSEASSEN